MIATHILLHALCVLEGKFVDEKPCESSCLSCGPSSRNEFTPNYMLCDGRRIEDVFVDDGVAFRFP